MTKLKPSKKTPMWLMLQTLYTENPSKFVIISSVHQNDAKDRLHYSLRVELNWGQVTIHVYGFWKSCFHITDTSVMFDENVVEIVEF